MSYLTPFLTHISTGDLGQILNRWTMYRNVFCLKQSSTFLSPSFSCLESTPQRINDLKLPPLINERLMLYWEPSISTI